MKKMIKDLVVSRSFSASRMVLMTSRIAKGLTERRNSAKVGRGPRLGCVQLFLVLLGLAGGFLCFLPTRGVAEVPSALSALVQTLEDRAQAGVSSSLVFDLDETVVDSTPRRLLALQLAREQFCSGESVHGQVALLEACKRVKSLRLRHFEGLHNSYSFMELWKTLELVGPELQIWRDGVERKTVEDYLSGRFEEFDQAVPGAGQFLQQVQKLGATVYFVSSRYEDVQGETTRHSLQKLKMVTPEFPPTQIKLRIRGESSLGFKKRAFHEIAASMGDSVIGVFENEPENLMAMMETFPRAQAFFREGAQLGEGVCPAKAHRIRDYESARDFRKSE